MIKGFARKLDHLGRATLPVEFRRTLGWEIRTGIDMYLEGKVIHLKEGKGRKLDVLGRYTLPMEVRRTLKLRDQELVDIYVEGKEICIRKVALQCVICGTDEEDKLVEKNGVHVCNVCAFDLVGKAMG